MTKDADEENDGCTGCFALVLIVLLGIGACQEFARFKSDHLELKNRVDLLEKQMLEKLPAPKELP